MDSISVMNNSLTLQSEYNTSPAAIQPVKPLAIGLETRLKESVEIFGRSPLKIICMILYKSLSKSV